MRFLKTAIAIAAATTLVGCGQVVEVGPAEVGKVMTKQGYKEGVIDTSKFRLEWCWSYCDKLVVLDASDQSFSEKMELFMPEDKLTMSFDVRSTLSLDPGDFEDVFSNVRPEPDDGEDQYKISVNQVYRTYARDIVRSEVREFLSQYTIAEISSSREAVNAELTDRLTKVISERTPFRVRYVGLADVIYPELIIRAQERSAERREAINQERAQLEISRVQLNRQLEEQQMQRRIDVERAQAEAEVNKLLGEGMTEDYRVYMSFEIMSSISQSDNKVFMPVEMLPSISGQMQLGIQ